MLRAQAFTDLFNANLDDTVKGIFLTTSSGHLLGTSTSHSTNPPSTRNNHSNHNNSTSTTAQPISPLLTKKACVLGSLTWRHNASLIQQAQPPSPAHENQDHDEPDHPTNGSSPTHLNGTSPSSAPAPAESAAPPPTDHGLSLAANAPLTVLTRRETNTSLASLLLLIRDTTNTNPIPSLPAGFALSLSIDGADDADSDGDGDTDGDGEGEGEGESDGEGGEGQARRVEREGSGRGVKERLLALEDLGWGGLVVGVFGPEEEVASSYPGSGSSSSSSPPNGESVPVDGNRSGSGIRYVNGRNGRRNGANGGNGRGGRDGREREREREREKVGKALGLKAEGLAEYLRGELGGFRMPGELM